MRGEPEGGERGGLKWCTHDGSHTSISFVCVPQRNRPATHSSLSRDEFSLRRLRVSLESVFA